MRKNFLLVFLLLGTFIFAQGNKEVPQKDKMEHLKLFLQKEFKVTNEGEIANCLELIKTKTENKKDEEINYDLLKESIKVSYSKGLNLQKSTELALELHNQFTEMLKNGFSKAEAKTFCIKTQKTVMEQNKAQIKEKINKEDGQKIMLQIQEKIQEKIKEKAQKSEAKKQENKTQTKPQTQKKGNGK